MNRVKNKHENHWQSRPLSHETDVLTFIKLPDNSYGLPPGVTSQLVKDGGLFRVDERFDRTIAFNGDAKVDRVTDADGNRIASKTLLGLAVGM
jgi:hypothetical protein